MPELKRFKLPELYLTQEEVDVLGDVLQIERAGQGIVPHPPGAIGKALDALQQWTTRVALKHGRGRPAPESYVGLPERHGVRR